LPSADDAAKLLRERERSVECGVDLEAGAEFEAYAVHAGL
jgi:hypothetical protein